MDDYKKMKLEFSNRIWKTKKARMNYAARLKTKHEFYNGLVTYYSCVVIVLSLLKLDTNDMYNKMIFGVSILVTIFSVHSNTKNYLERHINMKSNYVSLSRLQERLSLVKEDSDSFSDEYSTIVNEYQDLMNNCENHTTYDYNTIYIETDTEDKNSKEVNIRDRYKSALWKFRRDRALEFFKYTIWVLLPLVIAFLAVFNFYITDDSSLSYSENIQETVSEATVIE